MTQAVKALMFVALVLTGEVAFGSEKAAPLLSTQWGQRGQYAKYSPQNYRVGCWSTALGQILFHHRMFPHGRVRYRCTNGILVQENLDEHEFDESRLLDSTDEVAQYLYAVAVVIQKDFGTGKYRLNHRQRAQAVARHFSCRAVLYKAKDIGSLQTLIRAEIEKGRPVMIHLRDKKRKHFHAAVVDGYRTTDEATTFHINMGHAGRDDGWFRLDRPVGKYDDTAYHRLITVSPIRPRPMAPADAKRPRRGRRQPKQPNQRIQPTD